LCDRVMYRLSDPALKVADMPLLCLWTGIAQKYIRDIPSTLDDQLSMAMSKSC
jgi:hypothetical protein